MSRAPGQTSLMTLQQVLLSIREGEAISIREIAVRMRRVKTSKHMEGVVANTLSRYKEYFIKSGSPRRRVYRRSEQATTLLSVKAHSDFVLSVLTNRWRTIRPIMSRSGLSRTIVKETLKGLILSGQVEKRNCPNSKESEWRRKVNEDG